MSRIKRKHRSICRKHRLADKSKYKLNRKNRKIKFPIPRKGKKTKANLRPLKKQTKIFKRSQIGS